MDTAAKTSKTSRLQACSDVNSLKRRWSELERDVQRAEERCVRLERHFDDEGDLLWANLCNFDLGAETPPLEQRTGIAEAVLVDDVLCGGHISALSQSRTWQRAHRVRHQPQVESLLSHTAEAMVGTSRAPTAALIHAQGHAQKERRTLLSEPLFVELGAGKGLFARAVQRYLGIRAVAVDRLRCARHNFDGGDHETPEKSTHAFDGYQEHGHTNDSCSDNSDSDSGRNGDSGGNAGSDTASIHGARRLHRVHTDVSNLDLMSLPFKHEDLLHECKATGQGAPQLHPPTSLAITVGAKHLCAGATDLAIRCIQRAATATDANATAAHAEQVHVASAVIVPCCHPQVDAASFVRQHGAQLRRRGLLERDVVALTRLVAWGKLVDAGAFSPTHVRGAPPPMGETWLRKRGWLGPATSSSILEAQPMPGVAPMPWRELSRAGRLARLALERARAATLEATGLFGSVDLVQYVPRAITPDNIAIICRPKSEGAAQKVPIMAPPPLLPRSPQPSPQAMSAGALLVLSQRCDSHRVAEYILELRATALRGTNVHGGRSHCTGGRGIANADGWGWVRTVMCWPVSKGSPALLVLGVAEKQCAQATCATRLQKGRSEGVGKFVGLLHSDPLLRIAVSAVFPFTDSATSATEFAAAAVSHLLPASQMGHDNDSSVRVRCAVYPRAAESSIVCALESQQQAQEQDEAQLLLCPANFDFTVGVIVVGEHAATVLFGGGCDIAATNGQNAEGSGVTPGTLLWCALDRTLWNPQLWGPPEVRLPLPTDMVGPPTLVLSAMPPADDEEKLLTLRASWSVRRLAECMRRLSMDHCFTEQPNIVVIADAFPVASALRAWSKSLARAFNGGESEIRVHAVRLERQRQLAVGAESATRTATGWQLCEWGDVIGADLARPPLSVQAATCAICDLDRSSSAVVETLEAAATLGILAPRATVIARVQLGRKGSIGANRAAAHRAGASLVTACCRARFGSVTVHHLLSDRAVERTLVMSWIGCCDPKPK